MRVADHRGGPQRTVCGQWPEEWGLRGAGEGRCLVLAPAADLPSRALLGEGRSLHPHASCWGTAPERGSEPTIRGSRQVPRNNGWLDETCSVILLRREKPLQPVPTGKEIGGFRGNQFPGHKGSCVCWEGS